MDRFYIGADIGGTTVKLGMFSHTGELMEKWEIPTRIGEEGADILPDVAESIEKKREEKDGNIMGIGIGVPGPVTDDGVVLKCSNIRWPVLNVRSKLHELMGVGKIKVGNDANVAALGEMWKGGGRGFDSIVMITLGTGVGGGIILGGKILTGTRGAGGEIGHTKVEWNEMERCGCGAKGCLEQYVSAPGIVRMARRGLQEGSPLVLKSGLTAKDVEDSSLARIDDLTAKDVEDSSLAGIDDLTAKDVFDAAKAGDAFALAVVDRFAQYLGVGLANVAHVVDPEAFVIGGGVSRAGEIIIKKVEKYYNDNVLYALRDKEFRLAQLGNDAGIYGAVRMVL